MGNSLRCCIACVLPCGALDMVRVLHADGRVDVYAGGVTAGEVMKAYPKHVLGLPTCQNLVQKPTILHPEAELQKGKIYFLIPTYSLQKRPNNNKTNDASRSPTPTELSTSPADRTQGHQRPPAAKAAEADYPTPKGLQRASDRDRPVSQSSRIHRRRSRRVESCKVSMWRPALQSISEADFV
ncbi:hypothetical protein EJ110_NYTH08486 [Nymphaea thermarum]|nr:hypothetical protein EJ110_NYTH08486 [Nymphaea thermarum]